MGCLHQQFLIFANTVALFSLQNYGTHQVGFLFAPVVISWPLSMSAVGIYNIFTWNSSIVCAILPIYMIRFLKASGIEGWVSLGGVVLCITGAKTMVCQLGSFLCTFNQVLSYMGEAAFISKHHKDIQRSFYEPIPERLFWPVFIVTTLAAVGSQAAISTTFSFVSQCCALNRT